MKAFFAYPYRPRTIPEVIKNSLEGIAEVSGIDIVTWQDLVNNGRIMIKVICDEIDRSELFFADLTDLNPNVLFEFGYAIAKNKKIWIIRDTTIPDYENNFKKIKMLTTIGYAEYKNSSDIVDRFKKDRPDLNIDDRIYSETIEPTLEHLVHRETIFYLKNRHESESSKSVTHLLEELSRGKSIDIITDDPSESSSSSLSWYASQVHQAAAVVCHLTNIIRDGAKLHNAKISLVAGFAYGMDKELAMLIHEDKFSPADYRDILFVYETANEAIGHVRSKVSIKIEEASSRNRAYSDVLLNRTQATQLSSLRVGEWIAENESDDLIRNLFHRTRDYEDAISGRKRIFIGRKGTGKTATFIKLSADLSKQPKTIVSALNPAAYELKSVVDICKKYKDKSVKGNAIQSLWKTLIYSELLKGIFVNIEDRDSRNIEKNELEIYNYIKSNPWITANFEEKLEKCLRWVGEENSENQDYRLSEELHRRVLPELRKNLVSYVRNMRQVFLLVDNLDKAWEKGSDMQFLSEFLLSLLEASSVVQEELKREVHETKFNLVIFLRSDIYRDALRFAREPDKIDYSNINWDDPDDLMNLAEHRLILSINKSQKKEYLGNVWNDFFCDKVNGIPVNDYLADIINPRPRDLLYFLKTAISTAVNKRHARVSEADMQSSEKEYSYFAIESITVEIESRFPAFNDFLLELLGDSSIISHSKISRILAKCEVLQSAEIIDLLLETGFLQFKVGENDFRTSLDATEISRNRRLAERHSAGREIQYRINRAYWKYLELNG